MLHSIVKASSIVEPLLASLLETKFSKAIIRNWDKHRHTAVAQV